jgi:hypothetical protein
MKKEAPQPTDAPREAAGNPVVGTPETRPSEEPGVGEEAEEVEMGGEAPCQLHRFDY